MQPLEVLAAYPDVRPQRVESLGLAGGFSGALFWKVETPAGDFCLRRWPSEHPSEARLRFIHAVLKWAGVRGCPFVPIPRETREGGTFVSRGGFLWELAPWMPGTADYRQRPSVARLGAALSAIARFHKAVAAFPLPDSIRSPDVSPGIRERRRRLAEWAARDLLELSRSLPAVGWPDLTPIARKILETAPVVMPGVDRYLQEAQRRVVALQPCLCDVWHDHVLYTGDRVTGLIDFGSLRFESVAADVARLLGSMVLDDAAGWQAGLRAYEAVRPLSEAEFELVAAFDRSAVVMSGLNWIDWIYLQRREFPSRDAVLDRLREILRRLEATLVSSPCAFRRANPSG